MIHLTGEEGASLGVTGLQVGVNGETEACSVTGNGEAIPSYSLREEGRGASDNRTACTSIDGDHSPSHQ